MPALQYRQLQAPAQLNTNIPDNGVASTAQSLANTFKSFENQASEFTQKVQSIKGAQLGAQEGATLNPTFKSEFTAFGQAYNNAATRSYAIKSEADMEDTAMRLRLEANNDPETFSKTFGAVRDGVIKNAPIQVRGVLTDMYNRKMGQAMTEIRYAQYEEQRKDARTDVAEGIQRLADRIGQMLSADDPQQHDQADLEQAKLTTLIDSAQKDGTITPIEAASMHKNSQRDIVEQTVTQRFQKELQNPYGDPIGFINRLKEQNKKSDALLPHEEDQLVNKLMGALHEQNVLDEWNIRKTKQDEHTRFEAGDKQATSDLLSGQLTQKKLFEMVSSGNLSPENGRTLLHELQKGDPGIDDPKVAFDVKTNLLHYSENDIRTQSGLKWSTRAELLLKRREEANGWKATQQAKEGEARIDRTLGIVPGTIIQLLPDEVKTQRNQALTEWYNNVDALPPEQRQGAAITSSEDVIGRYIRKAKSIETQSTKQRMDSYIKVTGDPAKLGKEERKIYDAQLQKYQSQISAAEAEAARK